MKTKKKDLFRVVLDVSKMPLVERLIVCIYIIFGKRIVSGWKKAKLVKI